MCIMQIIHSAQMPATEDAIIIAEKRESLRSSHSRKTGISQAFILNVLHHHNHCHGRGSYDEEEEEEVHLHYYSQNQHQLQDSYSM